MDTTAIKAVYGPDTIQIIALPKLWDWEAVGSGEVSLDMLEFCDNVPMTVKEGAYAVSSNSFSDSFDGVLESLNSTTFSPEKILINKKEINMFPSGNPGYSNSPVGWAKTKRKDGLFEWRRSWSTSKDPIPFQNTYAAEAVKAYKLVFKGGNDETIGKMLVHAKGIETILVYPGPWFDNNIIRRAQRKSPTAFKDELDYDLYFGDDGGTLRGRIKSFVVALMPYQTVVYVKGNQELGQGTELPPIPPGTEYKAYILAVFLDKFPR